MTLHEVDGLDDLIYEHQCAFLQVPEYDGFWKPKHHFVQHTRMDILRYGPPRNVWCMAYEPFNQEIKAIASRSNFKNVLETVGRFWLEKSGRNIQKGAAAKWSVASVCVTGEYVDVQAVSALSPLVAHCLALFDQDSVGAVRTICSVDLHGDVIAENDWGVMCTAAGEHDQATRLMRIIEMVEMVTATDSILFARGESKATATPDVDVDRGGQLEMTADAFEVPGEQCAFCVADVSLIPVHITRQPISGNYVCHIMF
jgi:hypothetical protein